MKKWNISRVALYYIEKPRANKKYSDKHRYTPKEEKRFYENKYLKLVLSRKNFWNKQSS